MSGSLAARYIQGLPYDPSLGVGQYARGPRAAAATGAASVPGGALRLGTDATGQAVRVPDAAAATIGGVTGGGEGGGSLLLAAALGLLPYLPDAYNAVDGLLNPAQAQTPSGVGAAGGPVYSGQYGSGTELPAGAQFMDGSGSSMTTLPEGARMAIDGFVDMPDGTFLDATSWTRMPVQPGELDGLVPAPTETLDGVSQAPVGDTPIQGGWLQNPLGLPASFMTGDLGLGSAGGVSLDTAALNIPAAVFGMGTQSFAKPGGELGAGIGSTLGGIAGSILGGPWGAALGTIAGGAIGGQIGPAPTVGRNFSSIGTFDGSGNLQWGNSGGDNGASAADADPFANWFGQNLQQQAAAQGLAFNPNMTGAQIRVGGYDNFDRGGPTPGGYFYTPDTGGSPQNYAMRPSDDFWNDAYSPGQANAFSQNVLADLAARGVFTAPGANQPGMDFWGASQGTPLGWYGAQGGDYQRIQYGGDGFNNVLTDRQNAVQGWVNQQQAQGQAQAQAQQALGSAYDPFTQYDPNFGWGQMPAAGSNAPVSWQSDPAAMAALEPGWNTGGG